MSKIQAISFITRAFVARGRWTWQERPGCYPNIPASSGHRPDAETFVAHELVRGVPLSDRMARTAALHLNDMREVLLAVLEAPSWHADMGRLARGLPSGSVLEFANNQMLADALEGRRVF